MPSNRNVLAELIRDELLVIVDQFELSPPDRRKRDGLVETVAASKKTTLAEILPNVSRERLKEPCRSLVSTIRVVTNYRSGKCDPQERELRVASLQTAQAVIRRSMPWRSLWPN